MLAIVCYPFYKPWNGNFMLEMNLIFNFKLTADSCFVLSGIHQLHPVLRDMFCIGLLCVAKPF